MATVVNERDVLMAAAPARVVNVVSPGNVTPLALRGISLAAPTAAFRIATNGDPSPSAVTITATLKGIDVSATVTWAVTVGTGTLTGTGLSRTLAYANMTSDFVTVTASVVVGGLTYTDQLSFMKLHDGSVGGEGARGSLAVARAITGTSWSNTEALAALTAAGATSAISTDTCTLYNASVNYAEMRRYDGANWIPVGSSMPGSIMMNGSITTEKLLVTGLGIALNSDPNTQDVTAWSGSGISVISDTTAPNGSSALQCVGQGTAVLSRRFPLDNTQSYRVRTWAKQASGTSSMYLAVAFYDATGALISGSSSPSGWADHGTYHYYGLVGATAPADWTEYSASFGADEVKGIPAGAKFVSLGLISNFSAAGTQLVSGMICHLKTRGEMVVDGSLKARHIDSNGLSIRNQSGRVLLAAEGDSVPPWVTDLESPDVYGTSLLKPVTDTNTRQLRTISPSRGLKAGVSVDGNSLVLSSTSKEAYSYLLGGSTSTGPGDAKDATGFLSLGTQSQLEVCMLFASTAQVQVDFEVSKDPDWPLAVGGITVFKETPSTSFVGASGCGYYSDMAATQTVSSVVASGEFNATPMYDSLYGSSTTSVAMVRFRVFGYASGRRLKVKFKSLTEGVDAVARIGWITSVAPVLTQTVDSAPYTSIAVVGAHEATVSWSRPLSSSYNELLFSLQVSRDGTFSTSVSTRSNLTSGEGAPWYVTQEILYSLLGNWSQNPGVVGGVGPGNGAMVAFDVTPLTGPDAGVTTVGTPQPLSENRSFTTLLSTKYVPGAKSASFQLKIYIYRTGETPVRVDMPTISLNLG